MWLKRSKVQLQYIWGILPYTCSIPEQSNEDIVFVVKTTIIQNKISNWWTRFKGSLHSLHFTIICSGIFWYLYFEKRNGILTGKLTVKRSTGGNVFRWLTLTVRFSHPRMSVFLLIDSFSPFLLTEYEELNPHHQFHSVVTGTQVSGLRSHPWLTTKHLNLPNRSGASSNHWTYR